MNKQAKIILFSLLYLIGIISTNYTFILYLSLLLFPLLFYLCYKKQLFSIKYFLSLLIIFAIGLINSNLHLKLDDDLTPYGGNFVTLTAKVQSIPSNSIKNRTKFFAKVNSISFEETTKEILNAKTMVTIEDYQNKIEKIKIGDTIVLTGKLKSPSYSTNPSQFNYAKYLQHKDTFTLLYVKNEWRVISHANDFKGKLLRKLNDTRNDVLNIHRENIKSPMIEILGGIIFGDDAVNPDEETKESFIKSGIFHILAASGMNVTLIFGIWFFFAKSLRFHYKFSILMGICLISVYTCMTGFGPPIIRAFLMLTFILIGRLIDRKTSTISLLFIVGFLMLLYNPLMAYDIGFQLSFIVTFALIMTAPLLVLNFKYKFINYSLGACLIPIIAQFYAAPLQMYYFNTFAPYSILANIAIIPVLSLVSFIGFISSSLVIILPFISDKICFFSDYVLNPFLIYIVKVADFFATLPNSIIEVAKPSLTQVILYFALIIFLTCIFLLKLDKKKSIITISILILCFIFTFIPNLKKETEVIFFSVGNADSMLIKSPNNKYFLIDSAKQPYMNHPSQAKFIIIQYLKDKGIKTLDGIILSHFDSDHAGGTIDILDNINVKTIYISNSYENTNLSKSIINYIKTNNIKYKIVNKEEIEILKEKDFSLKVIRPHSKLVQSENEKSIIALVKDKNRKMLFMGDGNINTYNALPLEYRQNISVLKVGHHGAFDTLNKEIVDNSDLSIISTGFNVYNHPHDKTINLLKENNKEYYRTDYHNAIKIINKKNGIKILNYSPIKGNFIKAN